MPWQALDWNPIRVGKRKQTRPGFSFLLTMDVKLETEIN
jgi:hypothetical protein